MKRLFWKSAFVVSVLTLMMILVVPAMAGFEALFPARKGPDGLYRGGGQTGPAIIILSLCLWVADRLVASLFRLTRISGNRWSLLRSTRSWDLHQAPTTRPSSAPH